MEHRWRLIGGPNQGGGIDVPLKGEFFGQAWAAGTVTATGTGIASESASVGYGYVSAGHFGPWPCGTTITLTASPAQGNHFDRWESPEGRCATASTSCTVPITTTVHQITAYFAPTVYQLAVTNNQPDGIVTSGGGGGYVNPTIDCGSQPNGSSVVQVYTSCASGAIAQRSDSDVTQLFVSADNPGPGGDAYGVASIDGCDRSVATTYPIPGGTGTYVPRVQCFIDMNSNRTITVSYKDTGKSF
ncbi:MAG: InlB B-repeat-containing protein [Solirubrobacteraceae bacterium]